MERSWNMPVPELGQGTEAFPDHFRNEGLGSEAQRLIRRSTAQRSERAYVYYPSVDRLIKAFYARYSARGPQGGVSAPPRVYVLCVLYGAAYVSPEVDSGSG